jgi:DNA-binding Lrp family transcriptional regulator
MRADSQKAIEYALMRRGFPSNQADLEKIWKQVANLEGMFNIPTEAAVNLALQQRQQVVLLAGGLQGGVFEETVSLLGSWRSVVEYAKVWGKLDLLARLHITLFELQSIQRYLLVRAKGRTEQFLYYLKSWGSNAKSISSMEAKMKAWVIITAPAGNCRRAIDQLKGSDFPEVTHMGVVYGEEDVIIEVDVADNDNLSNLVYERLQRLDSVKSTRTYICVKGTYWQRGENS